MDNKGNKSSAVADGDRFHQKAKSAEWQRLSPGISMTGNPQWQLSRLPRTHTTHYPQSLERLCPKGSFLRHSSGPCIDHQSRMQLGLRLPTLQFDSQWWRTLQRRDWTRNNWYRDRSTCPRLQNHLWCHNSTPTQPQLWPPTRSQWLAGRMSSQWFLPSIEWLTARGTLGRTPW